MKTSQEIGAKKFFLPLFLIGCALSGAITTQAQSIYEPYLFTTFAGNARFSSSARFYFPAGAAVDNLGNIYVADTGNHTIRKFSIDNGVSTLAGLGGTSGSADGTGSAARFYYPQGIAADSSGTVYVADTYNHTIRKITSAGIVSTLAGLAGSNGSADGMGNAARFDYPQGIAVDDAGNLYVADTGNSTIRKITPAGEVSTLAGLAGRAGATDGPGNVARFIQPQGLAVDSASTVYVADTNNNTIRKITPAGDVSTLAGLAGSAGSSDGSGSTARFYLPAAVAVDSAGNVYAADTVNKTIRKISPSGEVSTLAGLAGSGGSADGRDYAARFNGPGGVAVDSVGNIFVADTGNNTIRQITPAGDVNTLAGLAGTSGTTDGLGNPARLLGPGGVAVDSAGNIFVADTGNQTIRKITPIGVVTTLAGVAGSPGSADGIGSVAQFSNPVGVAVDSAGNVYVGDYGNHTIRKITSGGVVSTLAGLAGNPGSADGAGSAARFNQPEGVTVDGAGNVYVADLGNDTIRRVTPAGVVSTLAGLAGSSGSADGTGSAARFNDPTGVTVDSAGNLYVADFSNSTIRKITPAGVVSTLAGLAGSSGSADGTGSAARFRAPAGVAADSAGNVYVADSQNYTIRKITPSGVVSTLAGLAGNVGYVDGPSSTARFNQPNGVAVDSAGNVYVADSGNNTIRKITPAAVVSTLAGVAGVTGSVDGTGSSARFNHPAGVAVDSAGNVYVADAFNSTIRKITPTAVVSTLAGLAGSSGSADGTGSNARFFVPYGVAVDSAGNVYVADTNNSTIRKITPSGDVTTFAGLAGSSGSADGTGSAARFSSPNGVTVDSAGNVYVGDTLNYTIRKITPAGVVSTIAGLAGSIGSDDGTGNAARFYYPRGLAVDSAGNVYVADSGNNTIRKVTPSSDVTTFAGLAGSIGSADGTGSAARFGAPMAVATNNDGNVYVADQDFNTIRKITAARDVTTVGGLADVFGGDAADGLGSTARFSQPFGIAVDMSGKLYVGDSGNHAVRTGTSGPFIVSPLIALGTIGLQFIYQFQAEGATSLTAGGLPPGLNFIPFLGVIAGTPTEAGTFSVTLSASNGGRTTTATLMITIQNVPSSGPVIISTTSATGKTGRPLQLQVITSGGDSSTRLDAAGLPRGLSVDTRTGIISGIASGDGSSSVTLTVSDGTSSNTATLQLTFTSDPMLPVIVSPGLASLTPGQFFSYTINAPSSADPATDPTIFTRIGDLPQGLSFDAATGTISGTYTGLLRKSAKDGPRKPELAGGTLGSIQLFATNSHGTSTFPLLFLAAPSGAVNIATRLLVGTDENVLIGGFIVAGNAPKVVLIRALGPSTGLPSALQDPTLELHDSAGNVVYNDNWKTTQEQFIRDTMIPPADDRESAIVIGLDPGSYTAIVLGKNGATGIALVEVYDLGTAPLNTSSNAKLAEISTRGFVGTSDNVIIGGFIISDHDTRVIMRAIGPSLSSFGIENALQDTTLELYDDSGSLIFSNDDWRSTQEQQIIDTGVPPTDDRESAIVATLPPGPYTAIVRGKDNTTGVALVEVYALQ